MLSVVVVVEVTYASLGRVARHEHRDVSGGWLRPTVFGAMDGLVTNVSLIAGVGGGGLSRSHIVLTGVAGLVAGAFSMATGEFTSVTSQNELVESEVDVERRQLADYPTEEQAELAQFFVAKGVDKALATEVAEQVSRNREEALRLHARAAANHARRAALRPRRILDVGLRVRSVEIARPLPHVSDHVLDAPSRRAERK